MGVTDPWPRPLQQQLTGYHRVSHHHRHQPCTPITPSPFNLPPHNPSALLELPPPPYPATNAINSCTLPSHPAGNFGSLPAARGGAAGVIWVGIGLEVWVEGVVHVLQTEGILKMLEDKRRLSQGPRVCTLERLRGDNLVGGQPGGWVLGW